MQDLYKIQGIVNIRKGEGRTLKSGGMWVYDNEIESITGDVEDGGLVKVNDFDGYFMGIGFINRKSKITVRMLSRHTGGFSSGNCNRQVLRYSCCRITCTWY